MLPDFDSICELDINFPKISGKERSSRQSENTGKREFAKCLRGVSVTSEQCIDLHKLNIVHEKVSTFIHSFLICF